MAKKFNWLISLVLVCGMVQAKEVVVFYGEGCPHCAKAIDYLQRYMAEHPDIELKLYEVYSNNTNRLLFEDYTVQHGIEIHGVPTLFVAGKAFSGFNDAIGEEIVAELEDTGLDDYETMDEPEQSQNEKPAVNYALIGTIFIMVILGSVAISLIKRL